MDKRVILIGTTIISVASIMAGYAAIKIIGTPQTTSNGAPKITVSNTVSVPIEPENIPASPKVDPDSPKGRASKKGLPTPPDVNLSDWNLIYVNNTHRIEESFVPTLGTAKSSISSTKQDERICEILTRFAKDGEATGIPVYLSSGYRSYSDQAANLQRKLNQGYDYAGATRQVAEPGSSEHQTGLCCDILDTYRQNKIISDIEATPTYQWLYEHCNEYGFILRYPDGKEEITGIMYEPWHFRYVGVEAATYIMENGLCLEEFMELYGVE